MIGLFKILFVYPLVIAYKIDVFIIKMLWKWLKMRWSFYYLIFRRYVRLEGALVLGIAAVVYEIKTIIFIVTLFLDIP